MATDGRVRVSDRRSASTPQTLPTAGAGSHPTGATRWYNGAVTPPARPGPMARPAPPLGPDEAFGPPPPGEDPLLGELAAIALIAAQGAAALATDALTRDRVRVDTKSSATDMVSEVDRAAEASITAVLDEHRPDDGLLAEEGTTGIRWVVDPVDGTTNYLFGIPAWSVSVAAERDGRPVVGVVIDPSRDETWCAVEGRGARCNGVRCGVAEGRSELAAALLATGFGYDAGRRAWQAGVVGHVLPRVRDIRRFGSAALDLCWVAGGRVDGYYEWGLNPWDLSGGTVICREAGGTVDILDGRLILATTPSLRAALTALLTDAGATGAPPGAEPRHW
jgi:myo-inositol-1(or 4)-monophosphatase